MEIAFLFFGVVMLVLAVFVLSIRRKSVDESSLTFPTAPSTRTRDVALEDDAEGF